MGAHIVVVEDEHAIASAIAARLRSEGHAVDLAYDGPSGVSLIDDLRPDLVVLDLMLPGIDGLEVCRRIRVQSRVPVLMLTARGDETDRIVGLELGADDYLPKPFNPRELLARIRAVLRRGELAPARSEPAVEVGPLRLLPAAREVTLDGRAVELTTAEFDLLLALARSAGRVLTRDQLLEAAHGPGWAAYDRTVDVHVSRIRSKSESDPRHPRLLKTVRGVGYLLSKKAEG
ncbi:MAG: response regulator transcription factor [Acidobacteria bacterium]|nr:response regulator transcription factor [Acidobacteriota bacterium]